MSIPRIGLFSAAHMHAHSYAHNLAAKPDIEFAGFWDADQERGKSLATQWNVPYFESAQALALSGLDGAVITTENVLHRETALIAATGGVKSILCEKPLGTTPEDARLLISECESRGAAIATAFPCRFSPAYQKAVSAVQAGDIGKIIAIRATNRGTCPFGWFVDTALSGGGAVMDHTVHVADLLRCLLRDEASEVYAEIGNGIYHQSWDDTGFLTIKYQSGVFATLDTSWSRPPKSYQTWGDVTMEIIGEGGVIWIDLFSQSYRYYNESAGKMTDQGWGSDLDGLMVDDFARMCRGEKPRHLASGEDGARAVDLVAAAYVSASTGSPSSASFSSLPK
jgi:predicted dehydrogenase